MKEQTWQERAIAAEKTVAVLKDKVRSLYNGDASAIQKQLERARYRQEENRQRQALMAVRHQELQKHSERLEGEVRERTRAIRTILDNVTFGFLVVDATLVVREGCTKSCAELFGTERVAGCSLLDLLGVTSEAARMEFELGLGQVYDDFIPAEVSASQLPQRFEVGERVLHVEGRVIRAEKDDSVEAVLMTISDITALEAAQRQAHDNRVLISLLGQREAFQSFVVDAREQLEAAREGAARRDESAVRRPVHTVKGNAASFGLTDVATLIHREEERERLDVRALDRIEGALRSYLHKHHEVLEVAYDGGSSDAVVLSPDALSDLLRIIDTMPGNDAGELERWTQVVLRKPAYKVLGPIEQTVERLAERLEKQVDFRFEGADTLVEAARLRPVLQNLIHVVRNALDHGLERPEERGEKSPVGSLVLRVGEDEGGYLVSVEDDGRGIDTEKVVAKAIAKGVIDEEAAGSLDAAQKAALVFHDGLSTAERTTEISGRGVGMGALKAEVERLGGEVVVRSVTGRGTKVLMRVPKANTSVAAA